MKLLFFLSFFFNLISFKAQNKAEVHVIPTLNNNPIVLNEDLGGNIKITNLKFYLSNLSFKKNGLEIYREKDSYHLIDLSKTNTLHVLLNSKINDFDEFTFLLGIDSITNVSGACGGDLDPTKGMYWAWNSGYINFKLEGTQNDTAFEFHLGGYTSPYPTAKKIELIITNKQTINLYLNLDEFFQQVDILKTNKVMSPGQNSFELSKIIASLFYVQ